MQKNILSVGIDLGTTNSVLATVNVKPNGNLVSKVVDIPRADTAYNNASGKISLSHRRSPTLPSFVLYRQEENYEPVVGDFAKTQYPLRPHLVAKSIKSQMGNSQASGLSPDVPDKTPAKISSRILQHLLREASNIYKCKITEAIITVPANFDPVMCKATRDAAEMAGIIVQNPDGSERPILLSEPKAVIFDLINQIRNGELGDNILDLSTMKRVLVFDLGGGTLDITMHEIKRRDSDSDILKVDEIATNRYTLLGGDDFDEAIANEMFKRYQNQYAANPDVVSEIRRKKSVAMAQLRTYAENVKLDLSEKCRTDNSYSSGWDDEDENEDGEIRIDTGGSMGGIGYAYDGSFTKSEIENILAPFMADNLNYSDYKHLDTITDRRNIIYPIFDVLKKAADVLKTPDVKVDAVIVNGGMSKFYMITDRLKKFFGFDPIVALDPDQSVAKGAAVFHQFLRQKPELQNDMRKIDSTEISNIPAPSPVNIEWGKTILNDALYLGVKNDAVHMIIPTGAALPYESELMKGFKIEPLQRRIKIPIKSQNIDGSYRTIANGDIQFSQIHSEEAYVVFKIYMGESKVISMKAWTSYDFDGRNVMEVGTAEIEIDVGSVPIENENLSSQNSHKTALNASGEVKKLVQFCSDYMRTKQQARKSEFSQKIRECKTEIMNAGNRSDFAEPIIRALSNSLTNEEAKMHLFILARRIANDFSESELKHLSGLCLQQLSSEINGFNFVNAGSKVNTNIQALYTLSICGTPEIMKKIEVLNSNERYRSACLYAHAKIRTSIDWIIKNFLRDIEKAGKPPLQVSAKAIAVALKNDNECPLSISERLKIIEKLIETVKSRRVLRESLVVCVVALGTMCDTRIVKDSFSNEIIKEVENCIESIPKLYPMRTVTTVQRNCEVALKMIRGETLDADEEKYLLTKLEI